MTVQQSTYKRLSAFDWRRAQMIGLDMAFEASRQGQDITDRDVWWALFREAVQVAAISYMAPPRGAYPTRSSMPEAPDEISAWAKLMAYVRGQIEDMPVTDARPPQPSVAQITRAEMVLDVWHTAALRNLGDWKRLRKALYLRAGGCPPRKIRAITGISRQRLYDAKIRAMTDMHDFVLSLSGKLGGQHGADNAY